MIPPTQMRYYAKLVWKELFLKVKVNEANYVMIRQGLKQKTKKYEVLLKRRF